MTGFSGPIVGFAAFRNRRRRQCRPVRPRCRDGTPQLPQHHSGTPRITRGAWVGRQHAGRWHLASPAGDDNTCRTIDVGNNASC